MKKALYIILLLFTSSIVKGYHFKLTIPDLPMALNYVMVGYGHKKLPIDTLVSNQEGVVEFDFTEQSKKGLYRIQFSTKYYVDFIFNDEDVEISTLKAHWQDSLKVHKSQETQAYYIAKKSNRTFKWKMKQLDYMLDTTSRTNPYFQAVKNEYFKLQSQQSNIVNSLQKHYPAMIITKMAKISQPPFVAVMNSGKERKEFSKKHYFDNTTFKDTSLLFTDVYTNKVFDYLGLYHNSKLSQIEQQELYIEAVDNVMPLAYAGNSQIFDQVVDFMIDHFSRLRFDNVLNHILETYVDEHSCENYEVKASYQDKINKFLKVKVGDNAPDFNLEDVNGKEVTLESSKANYTLLVFWASWCPHCTQELPKIKELYNKYSREDLEVITISLDYKKESFQEFVKAGNFTWKSCSDFKGWKSEVVQAYNVYGTPTIYLIDKNKSIVAKPANLGYLKTELKKYMQ